MNMNILTDSIQIKVDGRWLTHAKRKNSITPHIFRRHGIKTPTIHPNLIPECPLECSSTFFEISCKDCLIIRKREYFDRPMKIAKSHRI